MNWKCRWFMTPRAGGDASTRFLASFQDAEMAALKDSAPFPELPPNMASRGREGDIDGASERSWRSGGLR